jgi:hypothetical protein
MALVQVRQCDQCNGVIKHEYIALDEPINVCRRENDTYIKQIVIKAGDFCCVGCLVNYLNEALKALANGIRSA